MNTKISAILSAALLLLFSAIVTASDRPSYDGNDTTMLQDTVGLNLSFSTDTLRLEDMTMVIQTVCAPVCSSVVIIYNEDNEKIGTIIPPKDMVFAEAHFTADSITWTDNTPKDTLQ